MKKFFAVLVVLLVCVMSVCTAFASGLCKTYDAPFWETLFLFNIETNDTVYANVPNGVKVYVSSSDSSEVIGTIPYLSEINRLSKVGRKWSKINYEEKVGFVKTKDISTERLYEIKRVTNDVVSPAPNDTTVYSLPDENSDIVGIIPADWGIDRFMDLTNGWSMISFECNNYFAKTDSLYTKEYIGDYLITYYCPCSICNGPYGPYDSFGNRLVDGTAAVDPSVIPMNSTFYVEESDGLRSCVARDVGGAINGKHIDVFVDVPHHICENMGNTRKPVYVYNVCT